MVSERLRYVITVKIAVFDGNYEYDYPPYATGARKKFLLPLPLPKTRKFKEKDPF